MTTTTGPASTGTTATEGQGIPDPAQWLSHLKTLAVPVVALLSVGGWLEEVARTQAVEQYYGLPLTLSGDPRAAVAFAAVPVAIAVVIDAVFLLAVAVLRRHHVRAGMALLVVGLTVVVPAPGPMLVKYGVGGAVAALVLGWPMLRKAVERLVESGGAAKARRGERVLDRLGDKVEAWLRHNIEGVWALLLVAAVALLAIAIWTPGAVGGAIGRHRAAGQKDDFVLAGRMCHPNVAVIMLEQDGSQFTVRIVERRPGHRVWIFAPGVMHVPSTEQLVQVRLGEVAPSEVATFPPGPPTQLPAGCS